MPSAKRTHRVGEEFREILAEAILKLKDPRVGFVTVTHVDVAPDLKSALVFYTAMGEESERKGTRAALRSASGHLRQVIGHEVRLKFLPQLEFREDQSVESSDRVEQLLRKLKEDHAES